MKISPSILCFFRVALIGTTLLSSCMHREKPEQVPRWEDKPFQAERVVRNPGREFLLGISRSSDFLDGFKALPILYLEYKPEGKDLLLHLFQYQNEDEAFNVFQSIAEPQELSNGWVPDRGKGTYFRKGPWIGYANPGFNLERSWIQEKLNFTGTQDWGQIPTLFASILHLGRIPNSERVFMEEFMGIKPLHPIFAVQMECQGDSAWFYVSPNMPIQFASDLAHLGYPLTIRGEEQILRGDSSFSSPLFLEFSHLGMVGSEGCFDSTLSNQWIYNQKKALKSLKFEG